MKIYLAAGFTVTNVKGKERELSEKFPTWKRLFSYYWMDSIIMSEILQIKKDDADKQSKVTGSTGDSKARTC